MVRVLHLLRYVERAVLGLLMLGMTTAYVFNVTVRALFPSYAPFLAWIEEACLFGLVWIVFLGLAHALERGRHIAMTSALDRCSPATTRAVITLINVTGLIFSLFLVKASLSLTWLVIASGQVSPTLNVSIGWLYMAMPAGFLLLAFRYLLELMRLSDRHAARPSTT
jgi:C4-dicarboxylate transporter DctQ subunit